MQGVSDTTKIVFLLVFLSCFLGGDMMIYHQEDKQPNIHLDVYIQADMRILRFESYDYIASFSIMMLKKENSLRSMENKAKEC